jgi:hypothetical protein
MALQMAGPPGFEPGHDGVKVRCLTAWLRANISNGGGGRIRTAEPLGSGFTVRRV